MVALTKDILQEGYVYIVNQLRNMETSRNKIEILKMKYREEIGSVRALSQVHNLESLIDVLEKRDFLNEYAVDVLIEIMNVVGCDDKFKSEVNQHHARTCGLTRNYTSLPEWNDYCEMSNYQITEDILPQEVVRIVSEGMHESWEDLARLLDIAEGDIMGIRSKQCSDVVKCQEVLKLFVEAPRKFTKRSELKTALSRERRNDLLRKVDRIFMSAQR